MKYNTCEGCTVQCTVDAKYTHIIVDAAVPEVAVAAAAAVAAAPTSHQQQVAHPPPPPPPQPQNFNQAMTTLRNMETKVAVLEAEIQAMGQRMNELQLRVEERMDAQQLRFDERMDARDDDQFVYVTSEPTTLQWQKIRSPNSEDGERLPHDLGRMMQ